MTERERKDLELKEELFRLASERVNELRDANTGTDGVSGVGRYKMPDAYVDEHEMTSNAAKKQALLDSRYQDPEDRRNRGRRSDTTDQGRWEDQQIRKAGALDGENAGVIGDVGGKKYDLVLDPIDFEASSKLPALNSRHGGDDRQDPVDPRSLKENSLSSSEHNCLWQSIETNW